MFLRDTAGSIVGLDGKEVNASPVVGELILGGGGTAFTDTGDAGVRAIMGTGVAVPVTAACNFGVTTDTAAGTIVVNRGGDFEVILNIADYSIAASSGNITFAVQKNAAAFSGVDAMSVIRSTASTTTKGGVALRKIVRLAAGDSIRAVFTSAAGAGLLTITEGVLIVRQIKDRLPITNIG